MANGPTDAPNTTTLPEGALQPTTVEQAGGRKVISVIDDASKFISKRAHALMGVGGGV